MSREGYSSTDSSRRAFKYAPLFVALGFAASSHAANIVVDTADVTSAPDKCTIIDAVTALNMQTVVNNCHAGDGNNDTIDLSGFTVPTTISLTQPTSGTHRALVLNKKATISGALSGGVPFRHHREQRQWHS